jgi:Fe-S cluster assembly protein SufD
MGDFYQVSRAFDIEDDDWLQVFRKQSAVAWDNFSYPTRKTEDWKYTSLTSLDNTTYFSSESVSAHSELPDPITDLEGSKLVFINGQFAQERSTILAEQGVSIVDFSSANAEQQKKISARLGTLVDAEKHGFAALNGKLISDGVFVFVEKNSQAQNPIHILHIIDSSKESAVNARVLIELDGGAKAEVIEHFVSAQGDQNVFCNSLTELVVGDNADLRFYQLLEAEQHVRHIGGVHARLGRDAKLDNFNLAFGSILTRVDLTVTYTAPGAHAAINGVYLPEGEQLVDYHTCIEHAVPHCNTDEVFRGIVADQARGVFNGRIHIHKDAQKTEAYLSNKNLLTSNKAEIDTKPELEIYADDVRCAHGATVSQLDDNSLHYLKTRGVSEAEALVMLSFGFINELLAELKIEAVANYCRPRLAKRFSRDPSLTRHLN